MLWMIWCKGARMNVLFLIVTEPRRFRRRCGEWNFDFISLEYRSFYVWSEWEPIVRYRDWTVGHRVIVWLDDITMLFYAFSTAIVFLQAPFDEPSDRVCHTARLYTTVIYVYTYIKYMSDTRPVLFFFLPILSNGFRGRKEGLQWWLLPGSLIADGQ